MPAFLHFVYIVFVQFCKESYLQAAKMCYTLITEQIFWHKIELWYISIWFYFLTFERSGCYA